jgi:hypothetical protein
MFVNVKKKGRNSMSFRAITVRLYVAQTFVCMLLFSLFAVIAVILIRGEGDVMLGMIFFVGPCCAFFLGCIICSTIMFLFKKITINEIGVTYSYLWRNYFISWEDLKMVGTAYEKSRTPMQGLGPRLIYFDAHGLGRQDFVYWKETDEKFFVVCYRHKIWEEVQKYWKGELMEVRA